MSCAEGKKTTGHVAYIRPDVEYHRALVNEPPEEPIIVRNLLPVCVAKREPIPLISDIKGGSVRKELPNSAPTHHCGFIETNPPYGVIYLVSLVQRHALVSKKSVSGESSNHSNS